MGMIRAIAVIAFTSAVLAGATSAQTTAPGQVQPQVIQPQQGQVRAPVLVTPNMTLQTQPIPVIIRWSSTRFTGPPVPRTAGTYVSATTTRDQDGDGELAPAHGGSDCDDTDGGRAPGRTEIADAAGKDEDCEWTTIGDTDADGDGYVSWQAMNIVRDGAGRAVAVIRGPDCDDGWGDTHPNVPEVMGDQRDNDCDGEIDVIRAGAHRNYCAPTETTRDAASPCGPRRGDTSQWDRR